MKPSRLLEVKALIVIALPLIFAYLADVLMIITAKMVVGRLGATELAATDHKEGDPDRQRIHNPANERHTREYEAPVHDEGQRAPAIVEGEDLTQLRLRALALPVRLGRFRSANVRSGVGFHRIHGSRS